LNLETASEFIAADVSQLRPSLFDNQIAGFSIDSRTVGTGDLFFALSQEDYERAGFNGTFADGHDFIAGALDAGAIAAVARRDHVSEGTALFDIRDRLLLVDDAIAALQTLAHRVYLAWGRPVIAITGSAGKTTTKDLTAHILLSTGRKILKSERNYNNGLGLPLAVLQMVSGGRRPEDFELAVLEMGMSTLSHEIRRLCEITPPDIGVELLVAPVHLEYLLNIENIAEAKAELIEGLKPGGIAVLNADDSFVMAMRSKHAGKVVTFGVDHIADVSASDIDSSNFGRTEFVLRTPFGSARVNLPLAGRHNLLNALAGSAVASCLDIDAESIAAALATVNPPKMRGEVIEFADGFTVVDDSYNSNPRSLESMVRTLSETSAKGRRRLVIAGEMLELGADSGQMHREAGELVAQLGIEGLWGVRGFGQEFVNGAISAGMAAASTRFFENSDQAAEALTKEILPGDLVLVKGSRGVRVDKIVSRLKEEFKVLDINERG
jgi:UDP-N-acetylmuramoyl-tripeptide--D-alanyl-D-alanine ligase